MKLESQVTSLDLSKRLRELGVKQEGLFFWVKISGTHSSGASLNPGPFIWDAQVLEDRKAEIRAEVDDTEIVWEYAAFTVAELGVMADLNSFRNQRSGLFMVTVPWEPEGGPGGGSVMIQNTTEADARAKMLIHLIENKLITVEEVNERLPR